MQIDKQIKIARKKINQGEDIFSLPAIVMELISSLSNEEYDQDKIAQLLHDDIGMSAKILQLVNSASFGYGGKKITSVKYAVMLMGFKLIRTIALAVSLSDSMPKAKGFISYKDFWLQAFTTANMCQVIADESSKTQKESSPEDNLYFLAGLMHNVGLLKLYTDEIKSYKKFHEEISRYNTPLHILEIEEFGYTNNVYTSLLLESWNLPEPLVHAILHYQKPSKCPEEYRNFSNIIHLASWISSYEGSALALFDLNSRFSDSSWHELGLKSDRMDFIIKKTHEALNQSQTFLTVINS